MWSNIEFRSLKIVFSFISMLACIMQGLVQKTSIRLIKEVFLTITVEKLKIYIVKTDLKISLNIHF